MGVVLRPRENTLELVLDGREESVTRRPSRRRDDAPSGMSTQSGRWSSS